MEIQKNRYMHWSCHKYNRVNIEIVLKRENGSFTVAAPLVDGKHVHIN